MTNYWVVETYTKKLMSKVSLEDDTLHQQVIYAKGAPNERCYLECPTVTGNQSDDYVEVDGDPEQGGASALSLSYDATTHQQACLDKMRDERQKKLQDTDWMMSVDIVPNEVLTQTQQDNWAAWRQELRDLPENTADTRDFDFESDWPAEPLV